MSVVERALRRMQEPARSSFGVEIEEEQLENLGRFVEELLRWNRRINLTSVTEPEQVAELHILDSLAIAPWIPLNATLLDVGTGGGFPGVPVAILRPDVQVHLVDRTQKKILFLKATLAKLGIGNAVAEHLRIDGDPRAEGLPPFDVVVSRAFAGVATWFPLGATYLAPAGRLIAMLGSNIPKLEELEAARANHADQVRVLAYQLPSGAKRGLAILDRAEDSNEVGSSVRS